MEVEESYLSPVLSLDQIQQLTKTGRTNSKMRAKVLETLEERRKNIFTAANQVKF